VTNEKPKHNNRTTVKIRVTLTEEMLGTKPCNPEVFKEWVASKAPNGIEEDEMAAAARIEESGSTVFHRDDTGCPIIYDYQVKGFFKDAAQSLRNADGMHSAKLVAYKTKIDGLIFVFPRIIRLRIPDGAKVTVCERPLRADTAQGPRVALARSEAVPVGTTLEFEIRMLAAKLGKGDAAVQTAALVMEWLAYGELRGFGQWRNSGRVDSPSKSFRDAKQRQGDAKQGNGTSMLWLYRRKSKP
jgi:hypothetical protein